ncbi:MAG: HepT-like ribonuclease domain-containing protein [Acidithiobacillus sp.]
MHPKNAYKMRNVLIHGYVGVDHATVWDTIQQDLPALQ